MMMITHSLPCSVQVVLSHGKSQWRRSDAEPEKVAGAEHGDATEAVAAITRQSKYLVISYISWILL